MSHNSVLSPLGQAFASVLRLSGATLVSASVFLPGSSLLASTYDGQGVHLNSGESIQVNCVGGAESVAQLDQFGDTRYYSLHCPGGSGSASQPAPPVVENSGSKTTVHLAPGAAVHVVCYGGSANLDTAGNTRYYGLNCNQ